MVIANGHSYLTIAVELVSGPATYFLFYAGSVTCIVLT